MCALAAKASSTPSIPCAHGLSNDLLSDMKMRSTRLSFKMKHLPSLFSRHIQYSKPSFDGGTNGLARQLPHSWISLMFSNSRRFPENNVTRSDITFGRRSQYVIVRLKRSKTDWERKGVEFIVASSQDDLCPVAALKNLFRMDPQPRNAPLFRFTPNPLTKLDFVAVLRTRLRTAGIDSSNYVGHSLRLGAAQRA